MKNSDNCDLHTLTLKWSKTCQANPNLIDGMNFQNMGNLTTLICKDLQESLHDDALQNIFKNLTQLKHITIESLRFYPQFIGLLITDYGFTGDSEDHIGYSISNLTLLETLVFHHGYSWLSDTTLLHISKLKQLRYLDIFCKEVKFFII